MSLHYLVKNLCSNRHAQGVSGVKCRVRLSHSKNGCKIFVWWNKQYLVTQQKDVHISHIKNHMTHCTQLLQQRKNVAAKCCTWSAVGQSLMVSVCQSSQNWSTEVWYLLKIKSNESDITHHTHTRARTRTRTRTHTHTHPYNGLWILLKQETVSGSGISWAICKSAPSSRQTTMPAPHHSVFTGRMPFLHQTNSVWSPSNV